MLAKDLIKHIQKQHKPDEVLAWDIWCSDDVFSRAAMLGYVIDQEAAEDIIETMYENKDANDGFNWDTIEWYLNEGNYPRCDPILED